MKRPDEPTTATAVYTDGACSGNPGPGGWAWASRDGRLGSGGEPDTTNQRMELRAVLEALRAIEGPVVVHSDSTYVVNGINERWYEGWLARGWKNSQRKPVANRDLWEPLLDEYLARADELSFVWVKGHAGDPMNELVDQLAVGESMAQRDALAGVRPGGDDGAPESGERPGWPEVPWPVDRAVAVTGPASLDPEHLEGLDEVVDGLDPDHDIVVSGLRRGAELEAAERAVVRQIPVAVVLPYAEPDQRWPPRDRERFAGCLAAASWVVTLDGDPAHPGTSVQRRDDWIWQAVVGAIVVANPALVDRLETAGLGVIALE